MIKILFVCHGNICRSPMAEFIMKDMVKKAGLESRFEIASAAVSAEELGNPVSPSSRRILSARGIDCSGKVSRRVDKSDYEKYDLIIGMDRSNMGWMRRLLGSDPDGKLSLLLDWAGHPRDVADPWYTGDYDAAAADIDTGCKALLEKLVQSGKAR